MSAPIVTQISADDARKILTLGQQHYWAGFDAYCAAARTRQWPSAAEIARWPAAFRRGYNAAADAADYAEFCAWKLSRNSYDDLTEF